MRYLSKEDLNGCRRLALMVALCLTQLFCLAVPALADAPVPKHYFTVEYHEGELPEGAAYLDLLIKINPKDEQYTAVNSDIADKYGLKSDCGLVTCNSDGYVSFSAHYRNAGSEIKLISDSGKYQNIVFSSSLNTQFEDLTGRYKSAKIALFDRNGNLLQVSEKFNISRPDHGYLTGNIYYDAVNNTAEASAYHSVISRLFSSLLPVNVLFFGILFSVGIEILIAVWFRFKGRSLVIIALVNIATQVIMRVLFVFSPWSYWLTVLILETGVYIGEFVLYKIWIKEKTILQIGIYTVTANTASLLLGLLINSLGFHF